MKINNELIKAFTVPTNHFGGKVQTTLVIYKGDELARKDFNAKERAELLPVDANDKPTRKARTIGELFPDAIEIREKSIVKAGVNASYERTQSVQTNAIGMGNYTMSDKVTGYKSVIGQLIYIKVDENGEELPFNLDNLYIRTFPDESAAGKNSVKEYFYAGNKVEKEHFFQVYKNSDWVPYAKAHNLKYTDKSSTEKGKLKDYSHGTLYPHALKNENGESATQKKIFTRKLSTVESIKVNGQIFEQKDFLQD